MPFSNSSSIQALHVNNYFSNVSSNAVVLSNYYRGVNTGAYTYMPDVTQNSTMPASGAITFGDFTNKYKHNYQKIIFTAGMSGGESGYSNVSALGSLSGSDIYVPNFKYIKLIEFDYDDSTGLISLKLANTANTPSVLDWSPNNNLYFHKLTVNTNLGVTTIYSNNYTGSGKQTMSGPGGSYEYYEYTINVGAYTYPINSGSTYKINFYWAD